MNATASSPAATAADPRDSARPSRAAVAWFLVIAFVAVIAMTVPAMLGLGGTEWLTVATPAAQWLPAVASVLAVAIARPWVPLRRLWALRSAPAERAPARTWSSIAIVAAALVVVPIAHLAIAAALGLVEWRLDDGVLAAAALVLPIAVVMTAVAFGEEVGWRGFLWAAWRERLGMWGTVVVAALVWVAWHAPLLVAYGLAGDMPWRAVLASSISLALGGVLLGLVRERGGTVWPAAVGHGLMNSLVVFAYANLATPDRQLADAAFWGVHGASWAVWIAAIAAVTATLGRRR